MADKSKSPKSKPYKIDGKPPTIFRVVKSPDNPYVMIDSRPVMNKKLSFKAKGILTYLMSRPDGWEVSVEDLVNRSTDRKASVRAGMKELTKAGHMKYVTPRDKGRITGWIIEVYEVPQLPSPESENRIVATSPESDFQQVENQQVENRTQVVLKPLSSKQKRKKDKKDVVVVLKGRGAKKQPVGKSYQPENQEPTTTTFLAVHKIKNPHFKANLEMCARMSITQPQADQVSNATPLSGVTVTPEFIKQHVEALATGETIGLAIIRIKAGETPRDFKPGTIIQPADVKDLPEARRYSDIHNSWLQSHGEVGA